MNISSSSDIINIDKVFKLTPVSILQFTVNWDDDDDDADDNDDTVCVNIVTYVALLCNHQINIEDSFKWNTFRNVVWLYHYVWQVDFVKYIILNVLF